MSRRRKRNSARRNKPAAGPGWPGPVLFLDEIPTSIELACAPAAVSACVTARLDLLRPFLERANETLSRHGSQGILERIVDGTATDEDIARGDSCGREFNDEHDRFLSDAQRRGYGVGHQWDETGPFYALYCGHLECGNHSVEGIATASPVPRVPAPAALLNGG